LFFLLRELLNPIIAMEVVLALVCECRGSRETPHRIGHYAKARQVEDKRRYGMSPHR